MATFTAQRCASRHSTLIYCIGVVGEYVPADAAFLRRLHSLLRPGGIAFFTVTDSRSRISVPENARPSFARRALRKGFPLLPPLVRELVNRYFSPSYTTPARMERLLRASPSTPSQPRAVRTYVGMARHESRLHHLARQ